MTRQFGIGEAFGQQVFDQRALRRAAQRVRPLAGQLHEESGCRMVILKLGDRGGQVARLRMRAHSAHHVRRDLPLVQGARAARGKRFEGGGILGIHDALADRLAVVDRQRARLVAQIFFIHEQRMQPR